MIKTLSKLVLGGVLIAGAAQGISLLVATQGYAACTSPAAAEGELYYDSTAKMMQFCNDTSWVDMSGGGGGGGGTSVTQFKNYFVATGGAGIGKKTWTKLPMTEALDASDAHVDGTGTYIAPEDGDYFFTMSCTKNVNGSSTSGDQVIRVDDVTDIASSGSKCQLLGTTTLTAGQSLSMWAYGDGNSSRSWNVHNFEIYKVD